MLSVAKMISFGVLILNATMLFLLKIPTLMLRSIYVNSAEITIVLIVKFHSIKECRAKNIRKQQKTKKRSLKNNSEVSSKAKKPNNVRFAIFGSKNL